MQGQSHMTEKNNITLACIELEFKSSLKHCAQLIPLTRWHSIPEKTGLHTHVSKYGLAVARTGEILFHKAFLATESRNQLRATMRHELTHFCVGLEHNHDKVFKRVCNWFSDDVQVPQSEIDAITGHIKFKWQIKAHMAGGETVELGGVHRKTKIYTHYPGPKKGAFMSIKGVRVERFEFIEAGS
jgi:hypothetical protein